VTGGALALGVNAESCAHPSQVPHTEDRVEFTSPPREKAPRPLRILILGGTGFIGPYQVQYALDRGHTVTLFNPSKAGADTVLAAVSGPAQPAVGSIESYTSNAVPNASGYQFRAAPLNVLSAIEGAENGTAGVTVEAPAGYAIVSTAYHAGGTKSFHFTNPEFQSQAVTLNRTKLSNGHSGSSAGT
jgi:hypothetical protein